MDLMLTEVPLRGETIADLIARSGFEPHGSHGWLDLAVTVLFETSPQRRAYDGLDDDVLDLIEGRAAATPERLGAIDDAQTDLRVDALRFAARAGYALGLYAHLPEAERVARARLLAGRLRVRSAA